MNTLNFLDANVYLALLWNRHVHSEVAWRWFQQVEEQQFYFCRFTQLTVLRLLTNEQVMGTDTKNMQQAWTLWDELSADPRVKFLPEPDGFDNEFRRRSRLSTRSPKFWADAYLLAFASILGLRFVTFDRALRVHGLDVLVL